VAADFSSIVLFSEDFNSKELPKEAKCHEVLITVLMSLLETMLVNAITGW